MKKDKVVTAALTVMLSTLMTSACAAQSFPVTPAQRQTAEEVAKKGLALSELAPNAPASYTIQRGDTLWAISKLYLQRPWRWPELWGMNLEELNNPHLIYPGQVLLLEHSNGLATLRVSDANGESSRNSANAPSEEARLETVHIAPRVRIKNLPQDALPTLKPSIIEAFLAEPIIVTEFEFNYAPRIVSAQESRVLLTRGDRAYARGPATAPLLDNQVREKRYRIFREATPLKDPETGEVLGHEAIYVGNAILVQGESSTEVYDHGAHSTSAIVPATIDIVSAKSEIRVGDRLFAEPARQLSTYTPHAPDIPVQARVVSIYGTAVVSAAQNQIVAINRGTRDGMAPGHVLAILKDGTRVTDKTDPSLPLMKLPNERNGLLMVFRTFDRLSYALILEITDAVRVGDRLVNPR